MSKNHSQHEWMILRNPRTSLGLLLLLLLHLLLGSWGFLSRRVIKRFFPFWVVLSKLLPQSFRFLGLKWCGLCVFIFHGLHIDGQSVNHVWWGSSRRSFPQTNVQIMKWEMQIDMKTIYISIPWKLSENAPARWNLQSAAPCPLHDSWNRRRHQGLGRLWSQPGKAVEIGKVVKCSKIYKSKNSKLSEPYFGLV